MAVYCKAKSMLFAVLVAAGTAQSAEPIALAIDGAGRSLFTDPYSQSSDSAKRNTEDFLSAAIGSAWRLAGSVQTLQKPRFSQSDDIEGLPGLANPDTVYASALIEATGEYRIHGVRGSHAHLTLQFLNAYPMIGLAKDLLVIDFVQLGVKPGDSFELYLGGSPRAGHWWPLPEGAKAVLMRQTFNDWASESKTQIAIERLDRSDLPGPVETRSKVAAQYLKKIVELWS